MSETYKVKAVRPEPKEWQSAYGPMLTYTVLLEGRELPVEINKKPDSPAPQSGDEVFGDINRTEYGDKFKSAPKPYTGQGGGKSYSGGKPQGDPFTMYLSYAKDLVVAQLTAGRKIDMDESVQLALGAAYELYEGRPEAKSEGTVSAPEAPKTVEDAEGDNLLKNIDDIFSGKEEEEPWQEPTLQRR